MKYLTGVANQHVAAYASQGRELGLMLQPQSAMFKWVQDFPAGYAYDNGAFGSFLRGEPFDAAAWRRGLARLPGTAVFVTVPDVVGSHEETLTAWSTYLPEVLAAGQRPAFVLQNGCTSFDQVPAEATAVFIGGDDAYKLSPETARICWDAREAGLWVHMGRCNSRKRWLRALAMGCDSADGTFLRFGAPSDMLERLDVWLEAGRNGGAQLDILDATAGVA